MAERFETELATLAAYATDRAEVAGHGNMGCRDAALDRIAEILTALDTVELPQSFLGMFEGPMGVVNRPSETREHYETERLKRIIITQALVPHANGQGMSVSARRAADEIIALVFPDAKHEPLPEGVTSDGRITSDRQLAQDLFSALTEAVSHLDYCGYGDSWESECANHSKLPERLDAVLERGREAGLQNAE